MITQKRIKELLSYNQDTGIFIWKESLGNRAIVGNIAGSDKPSGYRQIKIDTIPYLSHRLAWLYVYGYLPENHIDHINRDKSDNRIKNLREVSRSCNIRNSKIRKDNKSGIKGVTLHPVGKWVSRISTKHKTKTIGYYDSLDEAICARLAAEQCLKWWSCESYSPAYRYVKEHIQKN